MVLKLYEQPIWVIGLILAVVLLLSMEVGAWNGRRLRRKSVNPKKAKNIARNDLEVGAMLALLGLMLAFSYSFGLSRLDLRKQALTNETNAIGTAFLRADLLPDPGRTELRRQLYEYAATRVLTDETSRRVSAIVNQIAASRRAQAALWPTMKQALTPDVPGHVQMLTVQSINSIIDADTVRNAVGWDRFPVTVFAYLLALAGLSIALAAQNGERNRALSRPRIAVFALALASLIFIIIDFDNSLRGMIRVNQSALIDLIGEMRESVAL